MVYFDQILHTYTFQHCLDTGMQNGDEVLLNISPAGHGQLVKMLITVEPIGNFLSKFAPFLTLLSYTLSAHCAHIVRIICNLSS